MLDIALSESGRFPDATQTEDLAVESGLYPFPAEYVRDKALLVGRDAILQCVAIIRAVVRFSKLLKSTIFVGISHGIPNGSRLGARIGTKTS
jgi:hypothetical protein